MAEDRGFEPLRALTQHAFQACALGHYANPPPKRIRVGSGWLPGGWGTGSSAAPASTGLGPPTRRSASHPSQLADRPAAPAAAQPPPGCARPARSTAHASGSSASSDIAIASARSQPPGEVSTSNQASAVSNAPVADAAMVSRRDRRSAQTAVRHQPEQQAHVVAGPGHVVVLRQLVGRQRDGGDDDPRQQDRRADQEDRRGPPHQPGVVGQHPVADLVADRHQVVQPVGHPLGGLPSGRPASLASPAGRRPGAVIGPAPGTESGQAVRRTVVPFAEPQGGRMTAGTTCAQGGPQRRVQGLGQAGLRRPGHHLPADRLVRGAAGARQAAAPRPTSGVPCRRSPGTTAASCCCG